MTSMAALTAGMDRPGAIADLGPGGPPAARTTGPAGGDRSAAVSSGTRTVRSWPLLVLAAPAAAEVWSGWVGIAQKTGFGLVSPLPGILPSLHLDTSITLPVGVEAYAAYALRAWLAGEHSISGRTRRFAKWSAICSFALGMAGQVAYHLLAQAGAARAPWPVTTIVSCLPVLVLAMGTTLAHMLRADADTAADAPDNGTGGPAVSRSPAWSAEDQVGAAQDQAAPQAPSGRVRSFRRDQDGPAAGPRRQGGNSNPVRHRPGTPGRQQACSSGQAGIQTGPAQRGNQGSNQALNALARTINAELAGTAIAPQAGTRLLGSGARGSFQYSARPIRSPHSAALRRPTNHLGLPADRIPACSDTFLFASQAYPQVLGASPAASRADF